jgi:hypothetical protein
MMRWALVQTGFAKPTRASTRARGFAAQSERISRDVLGRGVGFILVLS